MDGTTNSIGRRHSGYRRDGGGRNLVLLYVRSAAGRGQLAAIGHGTGEHSGWVGRAYESNGDGYNGHDHASSSESAVTAQQVGVTPP
jgi:hypothetical protein